ncbi:D-amino acid oxidase Aao_1 [Mycobacteroides abscessus subsp. bolletii]|uniref:FAD-dependent oxidoreductase n=1 Tax=Mycobacteroides abscessus TaxID=36809 RepID=UPI00092CC69C|nr:FAD-dependent oxidoreductase [Mycobacteroides abscessus]QSM90579.1 FAD-dependent oxidoreductase [Mycobacteroides abscessus subsp. bolletii]SHQ00128.1 D-amino acid oxidase Aao_1 [Mycobacteroides abscessus subsp. bolletii]SHR81986.1 D-amino acid oxidase Aao_1 [Mycobacteroides abscessus subsp. bolletii]SHS56431.1 D-amino acid oxidase Aao_1 [Mycobacteroides abscessus subsp. bolletii]SHS58721.1 D-amino acid oxidase Aao_1 [Mycobacteroides abscessus subsp. bolletii]
MGLTLVSEYRISRTDSVLVIGAGVSGLTTAFLLARAGFDVKIIAEKDASECVSVVAGALWEWPPAVCGYHHDQVSLARSKEWCMESYRIFGDLSVDASTGVFMRTSNFYFTHAIDDNPHDAVKMRELIPRVEGFIRDPGIAAINGVNPEYGVVDAYAHLAPMIDTDVYTKWLLAQVLAEGVEVIRGRISGRLADQEQKILDQFKVRAIVNCAGLGSAELHGKDMYPLRGALVRVRNDGTRMPKIEEAHCVSHDERRKGEQDIVFIVPRGEDMVVLGGLAEPDQWNTEINLENHRPVREMYDRCIKFMPDIEKAEIDPIEPVRAGLRPFRPGNVCLESEPGTAIVHNYAHGGAGFSFSWGCAGEVVNMVKELARPRIAAGKPVTPQNIDY